MNVVGIRRDGGPVEVGSLSGDGTSVTVLAGLAEFRADPAGHCPGLRTARSTGLRRRVRTAGAARRPVVCIGLNYLEHVAEGSYAGQEIPPHPA